MAIVRSIRDKSSWAVGIVAVALLLFIVGEDIFRTASNLLGGNSQNIGEINGESIDQQEFAKSVETARLNFEASYGRSPQDEEMKSLREQVWQNFVFEKAYTKQYEALGLKVTDEELVDMVQGNNIHPSIKQQFVNQQTGQFDKNQVVAYLKTLSTATEAQQLQWKSFTDNLAKQRLSEKYAALINSSTYITNLEAKEEHNIQNSKADARYLFIPFYSINDSTIKVEDSQIEKYYSEHKGLFVGNETRTFDYAAFQVVPSKKDSADLYDDIKRTAKDLASSGNDSLFALSKSELRVPYRISPSEMTPTLKGLLPTMQVGGVYGPVKDGNAYSIYKYNGVVSDTVSSARASHILIAKKATGPEAVAAAKIQAEGILTQIKAGANFEQMAMQYSEDAASKQLGGDVGTFAKGRMVKPFENAVFGASSAGLLPNLVETDYGFHIIKVTEPRSNLKYRIATVSKILAPSEATKNEVYQQAESIRSSASNKKDLEAALKKYGKVALLTADRVSPEADNFGTITSGREVVSYMFRDAKVDKVADKIFEVGDQFVVAVLTAETSKDNPKAMDFKDAISYRVRNEIKAEKIIAKLGNVASGTLEQLAAKYGAGALVETVTDINMNGPLLTPGPDATGLGSIFGGKIGKRSKVVKGDQGVFVTETSRLVKAPEIADYSSFKPQVSMKIGGNQVAYMADQVIRTAAKIKDNRYKFY